MATVYTYNKETNVFTRTHKYGKFNLDENSKIIEDPYYIQLNELNKIFGVNANEIMELESEKAYNDKISAMSYSAHTNGASYHIGIVMKDGKIVYRTGKLIGAWHFERVISAALSDYLKYYA